MARNWTNAQLNAINATDGSILVSAAAGSGKTAVLVERVIRLITREKNPVDVDRLLIVTFTRAAAAEMLQRLSEQINKLLLDDPYNPQLLRQKQLMYNASISTIDSFCSSVVREYFHVLNVPRDFRLADNGELDVLSAEALDLVLEEFYAEGKDSFFSLADAFSSKNGDQNLRGAILKITRFLSTQPFPEKWLSDMHANYNPEIPIADTIWGKIIINHARTAVSHLIGVTESSISLLNTEEDRKLADKLTPIIVDDLSYLRKFSEILQNESWDEIVSFANKYSPAKLVPPNGYKEHPTKVAVANRRAEVKKTIEDLQKYFAWNGEEATQEIASLREKVAELFRLVTAYVNKFSELKAKKNILSFSDVELLAVKLLAEPDENGYKKTLQAEEISKRFDYVMVDEFQDVNDVQDLIFRCVSTDENNLFTVGDVKQSIYGFRQAKPEIFIDKKEKYNTFDENNPEYPATIILDKNFRSRVEVCNAVNVIFSILMNNTTGKMKYTSDEYLNCGAVYPDSDNCAFELDILEKTDDDPCVNEAKFIANKIHAMLSSGFTVTAGGTERPATYGDFAIILRSTKGVATTYVNTLNEFGIPASSEIKESFFDADEIKVMLNFLRIIDNPSLDIPLLSVMCSPIYGFTPDELAQLRAKNRYTNLYSAVADYSKSSAKAENFINELAKLKAVSYTCSIDELIGRIYELTSFSAIISAVKGGNGATKNLNLLREYARKFESNGYKGLSSFIIYMDKLIENGADLTSSSDTDGDSLNKVRVLSIHASKGLEFPVCILANTAKGFNKTDLKEDVLIDSHAGLGIKHIENLCRYNTLPRMAVCVEISENEINEEIRVLYVALTRAKEKLIVLSTQKEPKKYIEKLCSKISGDGIDEYTVMNSSSFSDWICLCAIANPHSVILHSADNYNDSCTLDKDDCLPWDINFPVFENYNSELENTDINTEIAETSQPVDEEIIKLLEKRIEFQYPNQAILNIPQKVTASQIAHDENKERFSKVFIKPNFLNTKISTAVERGTAHHKFLQYCDFTAAKADVSTEIDRLVGLHRLTKEQAELIDRAAISDFMNSSLIVRVINSPNVMREERFTVKIKASLIDDTLTGKAADTAVVMQGAVDMAFEEKGSLVLVDYKTDRVKELETLRTLYSKQLELYKNAIEQSTEMHVSECLIYSIHLNDYITVAKEKA